jgi:hypothetical protein
MYEVYFRVDGGQTVKQTTDPMWAVCGLPYPVPRDGLRRQAGERASAIYASTSACCKVLNPSTSASIRDNTSSFDV